MLLTLVFLKMTSWTGLSRHIKDAMIMKVGIHQTYASQTHESNLKSTFTTHWYAGGQSLVCGGVHWNGTVCKHTARVYRPGRGWGAGGTEAPPQILSTCYYVYKQLPQTDVQNLLL